MLNPRAILLDMGGVILDVGTSRGVPHDRFDWRGREAVIRFLVDHGGRKLRAEDLESNLLAPWRRQYHHRGETGHEASWEPHLDRLRARARVDAEAAPSSSILAAWFEPYGQSLDAMPGAVEAVAELAASGRKLALVSNVPLPGSLYRRVLERLRLDAYFESHHFSYDAGTRKPSPAMLRAALRALEVRPGEAEASTVPRGALMVGDRKAVDVAAGRAAGLTTVWLRSEHDDGPAADHDIGRLGELPGLLTEVPAVFDRPS